MEFKRDIFTTQLGGYVGGNLSTGSWEQWGGTTGELNEVLSYSYNALKWRTWSPETSTMLTDLGLMASFKIDFDNGIGDDHIILIIGFLKVKNAAPTINFVEASIQFYNNTDCNITSGPIKSDPNNPSDIADLLYKSLNNLIQAEASKLGSGDTLKGRQTLAEIASINLTAMIGTVS